MKVAKAHILIVDDESQPQFAQDPPLPTIPYAQSLSENFETTPLRTYAT